MMRRIIANEGQIQRPTMHVSIKEFSDVISSKIEYYEEIGNWRNCIFIPFNMLWKVLVMVTTVVNCNLVAYMLLFEKTQVYVTYSMYYVFEGIYFVNTVLTLLHRVIRYRRTRSHAPKNVYLIFLDIISLIPYYEVYYLLMRTSYGPTYEFATDHTRVKVYLRLFGVIAFFFNANNEPGINHLLAMTVLQMVCYSLYCMFFSAVWYGLAKKYHPHGWTANLRYHTFNNDSTFHWWIICNTFISSLFFHAWSGVITGLRVDEQLVLLVTMFIAFILQIIFYSNLTSLYIKQISDQYYFSNRLHVINNLLDMWRVGLSIKKAVVQVYNTFWEKRFGRSKMPTSFYTSLPCSLQKEVSLDTFWHFFRHSHFFNDTDLMFNRNLCLSMKCQFYTAGEFLYTKGELRNKIIYIVSGMIQLLSKDDQSSPVISFSSGTVLGEICCLMCVESSSYLRCATYCEIQVLEFRTLAYSMVKYPYISKILWQKLNARLAVARELQHKELIKLKSKEEKRTSIRWFKSQWRLIADLAKQAKRTYDGSEIPIVPYHFSKFLNLYVLSDEVELKVKAICLKSECPFVLDPRNKFKLCCDYLILIVVFIQSGLLPYYIIFKKHLTVGLIGFFYTLDIFYFVALYLDASTAVKTKDRFISNISDIIIYKGKQITIMIDILATIPLEIFAGMVISGDRIADLLHLNRILKIYRVVTMVRSAQLNVWLGYTQLRIIKYFLLYLMILYYFSCFVYAVICFWDCSLNGWYLYNKILKSMITGYSAGIPVATAFVSSVSYVTSTLFAAAWKEFFAFSIPDIVMEQIIANIGYYLINFFFGEMGACAVMHFKNQYDFREHVNSLKYFAERNNLSDKLTDIMYKATDCLWMYSNGYEISGKNSVIKHLPLSLHNSIFTSRITNCLKEVPIFKCCNEKALLQLASIVKLQICPPDMVICRFNRKPTYMYVILNGYCRAESSIPTDSYHEATSTFTPGTCFPCLEALLGVDNFVQVTSTTYLEIITINTKDLMLILKHYSDVYDDLVFVLQEYLEENKTVLTRQKGRLPDMVSSRKSQGRAEFFEYKCVDDQGTDEMDSDNFYYAFNVLGRWKFLRHLFLRKTIEPTSTGYLRWELIRCTISIIAVTYSLTLLKLCLLNNTHHYIELSNILVGLIDFYIRMHVRYYNDIGILVTHPLYTAGHYIGTSFSIDLIGVFPFYTLSINAIFGKSRRLHTLVILMLITRPLLMYRVFRGLRYLQSRSQEGKNLFYENLKYLIVVLLVISMSAMILEGFTCSGQMNPPSYSCPNSSWIMNSFFEEQSKLYRNTLFAYYVSFSIFSSSTVGTFQFAYDRELWMMVLLTFVLFSLRWYVLAKITSSWIGGNKTLVRYQHNMVVFIHFCKYYRISNNLMTETLDHYEHQWETSKGCNVSQILSSLHPVLRGDFSQFLYGPYLWSSEIFFDADQGLIRKIATDCREMHFKKESIVIHCNDINDVLYVVCKGQMDITVANSTICLLNPGGMFGCLIPHGATRQTITVRAKVHTTLLAIQSDRFTELIDNNPLYLGRIRKAASLSSEYLPPRKNKRHDLQVAQSLIQTPIMIDTSLLTTRQKHRFLIYADKTWYHAYNYFVDVHLSVWSSIIISLMIVRIGIFEIGIVSYQYLYIIDLIYWSKVIINFHLTYYDKETGILVTNHAYITRRYMKSWVGLWLDILTSFPLEIFVVGFKNDHLFRGFWLNRSCRFVFLYLYYGTWKKRLTITKFQRWTYLMYTMILIMHFTTCFWWLIACPSQRCKQTIIHSHQGYSYTFVEVPEMGYLLCFRHIVNVFTATGLKNMAPTNMKELIAMIVVICAGQFTAIVLTIGFANMVVLQKFMMSEYERKAKHSLLFMEATNVSTSLCNKVWSYFAELWIRSYGSWLPDLMRDSPSYLKQQLMSEVYGRHLSTNCLFKDTHVDFLRQLVTHLEPYEFMPGMYIVEKGDVDACMYFIQKGDVIVYDKHGNNEIEQANLGKDDSFGELQGLYGIPYDRSYKARFHCQILRLQKHKWIKMLKWFPASQQSIENAVNQYFKRTDTFAHY